MGPLLCPQLIGRQTELSALRSHIDECDGEAVTVLGEAGVGKSRLVDELAVSASAQDWLVLRGRSTPDTRATPYRPFQEALLEACRISGPPPADELLPFRPALGRLIPDWRVDAAAPESGILLAEGILRLLSVLARQAGNGVLVVLEDLHWADADSLAVLEYLVDHLAGPLMLLATVRPEPSPGYRAAMALAARRRLRLVELAPLAEEDVFRMARCCLEADELPAGLRPILARAEGLPFLVEELLSGGAVELVAGRWAVPARAPWVIPHSLADALERKVAELPITERLVPRAAAILGREVDAPLLAALLATPVGEVEDVLDHCVGLQLMVRDDQGYRFRHGLTRDTLLEQLGPARRAELAHRAIAVVRAADPELGGRWCAIAAELSRLAGDDLGAARLLVTDARRALTTGALITADDLLERAAKLAADDLALQQQITEASVDVATAMGDVDAAGTRAETLLASCTDRDTRARVSVRMAEAAVAAGRWSDAFADVEGARGQAQDAATLVRLDAVSAEAMIGAGLVPEARATAERALRAATELELGDAACLALAVMGRIARNEDVGTAEGLFSRQLHIAEAHGLSLWEIKARHELGTINLMRTNDVHRLWLAREAAARAGAVSTVATIDLQLASSTYMSWDVEAGLAAARRCQDVARLSGLDLPLAEALLAEAAVHAITGDHEAMQRTIEHVRALGPMGSELEATVHSRYALYSLIREDRPRALARYEDAVAVSARAPAPYLRIFWHYRALLRSLEDDDDSGGEQARAAVRPGTPAGTFGAALLQYGDAAAAGRAGNRGGAEALVEGARAQLSCPGTRPQQHLLDRLISETALAHGWGQPVEWLTDAAHFFRASGHRHLERACRSLLRRARSPLVVRDYGHRSVPPELAAQGITDRESDVLALLGDGLTSAEIAQRLYISPRTVDKHVERLLAKTGLAHRRQLRRLRTQ